jgi:hypothetical protein
LLGYEEKLLPLLRYGENLRLLRYKQNLPLLGYEERLPLLGYEENLPLLRYREKLPLLGYKEKLPLLGYDGDHLPLPRYRGNLVPFSGLMTLRWTDERDQRGESSEGS